MDVVTQLKGFNFENIVSLQEVWKQNSKGSCRSFAQKAALSLATHARREQKMKKKNKMGHKKKKQHFFYMSFFFTQKKKWITEKKNFKHFFCGV